MSDDGEVRITLRLPDSLRDTLKVAADRNGRSMNQEIVWRLEHVDRLFERYTGLLEKIRWQELNAETIQKRLSSIPEGDIYGRDRMLAQLERLRLESAGEVAKEEQDALKGMVDGIMEVSKENKKQQKFLETMRQELLQLLAQLKQAKP